jgi:hypothetical protein
MLRGDVELPQKPQHLPSPNRTLASIQSPRRPRGIRSRGAQALLITLARVWASQAWRWRFACVAPSY